jgi:hypothetical protein
MLNYLVSVWAASTMCIIHLLNPFKVSGGYSVPYLQLKESAWEVFSGLEYSFISSKITNKLFLKFLLML